MKPLQCFLMGTGIAFLSYSLWASASNPDANETYWQCSAHDKEETVWKAKHTYELLAKHKALAACKKQSQHPSTCKISKQGCDVFIHGVTRQQLWQCTALDQLSKPWVGKIHKNRDDAAIAARDYCKQYSGMPDTCYINLLLCKNLSEPDLPPGLQ